MDIFEHLLTLSLLRITGVRQTDAFLLVLHASLVSGEGKKNGTVKKIKLPYCNGGSYPITEAERRPRSNLLDKLIVSEDP